MMDEKVTQQKAELVKLISIHTGWIFGQHLADAEHLAEAILINDYRKLSERPKVISNEEMLNLWREAWTSDKRLGELVAQAQLEADIKYIWGEDA